MFFKEPQYCMNCKAFIRNEIKTFFVEVYPPNLCDKCKETFSSNILSANNTQLRDTMYKEGAGIYLAIISYDMPARESFHTRFDFLHAKLSNKDFVNSFIGYYSPASGDNKIFFINDKNSLERKNPDVALKSTPLCGYHISKVYFIAKIMDVNNFDTLTPIRLSIEKCLDMYTTKHEMILARILQWGFENYSPIKNSPKAHPYFKSNSPSSTSMYSTVTYSINDVTQYE